MSLVDIISLPRVSGAIKTTLFPRSPMLHRKCIDSYVHVRTTEPVHMMHVPLPSMFALLLRPDLSYLLTGKGGNIESSAQSRHRVNTLERERERTIPGNVGGKISPSMEIDGKLTKRSHGNVLSPCHCIEHQIRWGALNRSNKKLNSEHSWVTNCVSESFISMRISHTRGCKESLISHSIHIYLHINCYLKQTLL